MNNAALRAMSARELGISAALPAGPSQQAVQELVGRLLEQEEPEEEEFSPLVPHGGASSVRGHTPSVDGGEGARPLVDEGVLIRELVAAALAEMSRKVTVLEEALDSATARAAALKAKVEDDAETISRLVSEAKSTSEELAAVREECLGYKEACHKYAAAAQAAKIRPPPPPPAPVASSTLSEADHAFARALDKAVEEGRDVLRQLTRAREEPARPSSPPSPGSYGEVTYEDELEFDYSAPPAPRPVRPESDSEASGFDLTGMRRASPTPSPTPEQEWPDEPEDGVVMTLGPLKLVKMDIEYADEPIEDDEPIAGPIISGGTGEVEYPDEIEE